MHTSFEAIFVNGVLKPLNQPRPSEGERVRISIEPANGLTESAPANSTTINQVEDDLIDAEFHAYARENMNR